MSYSNVNGPDSGVQNPNARVPMDVMREALRYVTVREGVSPFAVNLPARTQLNVAERIMEWMPAGGELARASSDAPVYHIVRVWVRGNDAEVDVLRPVVALGRGADGRYPTQAVTVHLEGGLNPWRVVDLHRWTVGAVAAPAMNYLGDEQDRVAAEAAAAAAREAELAAEREAIRDLERRKREAARERAAQEAAEEAAESSEGDESSEG